MVGNVSLVAQHVGLSKVVMLFYCTDLHQRRVCSQAMLRNCLDWRRLLQKWILSVLTQAILLQQVLVLHGCRM